MIRCHWKKLYEKRGDAYLRLNNFAAALEDFNRIYRGLPKFADSIERWRDIGGYSLDVKTSVASGNAPSLWVKKTDKLSGYSVMNFILNCDSRQIKQAAAYRYNKDGEVKGNDGEGGWNGIIPESLGERLWEAGCKRSR